MSTSVWDTAPSIYGSDVTNDFEDIDQGMLGDCYFLSAISALGMMNDRLNYTIETDSINGGGVFAMRIYVKGVPTVVAVDDYIPFYNAYGQNSKWTLYWPQFTKQAKDGSIWGMLMEKVYAKVNGNYE